jgi:multidrug efflux pump subunit AcrB
LNILFLIALAFIFLVLAGSSRASCTRLTILGSVPLAVVGALATLWR